MGQVEIEVDGDGGAVGDVLDGRGQAPVGEDPGVDAPDQFPQFDQGGLGLPVGLGQEPGEGFLAGVEACQAQVHRQGDQSLLGAVVQVAFDTAALGLEGGHQAHPRPAQLPYAYVVLFGRRVQQEAGEPCASRGEQTERVGQQGEQEQSGQGDGERRRVGVHQPQLDHAHLLAAALPWP